MTDINALYASLLAADEARDAAALAAVAWQMYDQLATTAADLGALRARFSVYAAAPHASGRLLAARAAQTGACARRLCSRAARHPREMPVQMRKLTAAASVPLGTPEPPAQRARPSGNGQRQVFAASPRLRLGASQSSPAGGPNEGHRCWPRQDNGCLAAGPAAPLPVADLGPGLPCTDDPELFFAESPDDVETAKALCRECPARAACLAGALKRREPCGVWGGELFLRGDVRDLAGWLIDTGEHRLSGVFNVVGETIPLSAHLALAREVANHTGPVVAAGQDWLIAHHIQPWMGERSLPLWLPLPEYAGFSSRDGSAAQAAGLATRPLAETLADTLAWELGRSYGASE